VAAPVFPNNPDDAFFIAEAGVNHNGDVDRALELVSRAAECGADAIKFQTFSADRLVTEDAETAEYQRDEVGKISQHELLQRYELSRREFERLQERCNSEDIHFLSSPFDVESADMLNEMGVSAFKVGSGELTNTPFLERLAALGRPLIVSTGMSTMEEVNIAYECVREIDRTLPIALLHCTSSYPAPINEVNLRAMQTLSRRFPVPVGYSDHTTSVEMPALATAAGALIVEKHFTLDRTLPGPDHGASLEPDELARAVSLTREAVLARGDPTKRPVESERDTRETARKSLHAARALTAGEKLDAGAIAIKRPNHGLPPAMAKDIVGSKLRNDLPAGAPITEDDIRS
jgi:N-acetylneuraminate synthase/N,N'-diacetyllegionaminate synthase